MGMPEVLENVDGSRILDLDVRGDLRSGKDPFQRIMHARQALADDGVLRLRATIEPRPLYAVLGKEGFEHWTEQLGDDDWRVWFYRGDAPAPAEPIEPTDSPAPSGHWLPTCGTPRPEPADITVLDVRGLEPPEPMVRTLEALAGMPSGNTLIQLNARVPQMLLPKLDAQGFQATVREDEDGLVRVAIRPREELPVLDVRLLPPREKHPTIFKTFDGLEPGEAFVILNDHDPMPLRYQFQGERPEAFSWAYQAEGPEIWRVEIGRTK